MIELHTSSITQAALCGIAVSHGTLLGKTPKTSSLTYAYVDQLTSGDYLQLLPLSSAVFYSIAYMAYLFERDSTVIKCSRFDI